MLNLLPVDKKRTGHFAVRYLNHINTVILGGFEMQKTKDIMARIEQDLNEEIIDALMDLNYSNAVSEHYFAFG